MKLLYKCDDCETIHTKRQLRDVGELDADYLVPGGLIPHGRCRKCDAGCYPLVLDLASRKVLKAIAAMWDALSDILEHPETAICRKPALQALQNLKDSLTPALINQLTEDARKAKGARP